MSGEKLTIEIENEEITVDADGFHGGMCIKEYEKLMEFLKSNGIDSGDKHSKMKSAAYEKSKEERTLA